MKNIRGLFCLTAVTLFGLFAMAQSPTGTIQGVVTDSTGATVQGGSVTVVRTTTRETSTTTTDSAGRYSIPFVQPGIYTVNVEAKGFRSATQENVQVDVAG